MNIFFQTRDITFAFCFPVKAEVECLTSSRGGEYKGRVNVTRSGRKCQAWSEQTPHQHTGYKALVNDSNYCRNLYPKSNDYHPWCYTTDPNRRWEFCDIPACGNLMATGGDCPPLSLSLKIFLFGCILLSPLTPSHLAKTNFQTRYYRLQCVRIVV